MKDRKSILKKLLTGQATRPQLEEALMPENGCTVFTYTPEGLYSGGGYSNLTEDQARELAGPTVIFLPDNGR